jgi:hydroxymethylglutaryl-CoA reductase (NADPH)
VKQEFLTPIPTRLVGPIRINSDQLTEEVMVPLATYETPLWPSVARGAKLSRLAGGIEVVLKDESMTRSILVEAPTSRHAAHVMRALEAQSTTIAALVQSTSQYAQFKGLHMETVGPLLFIRLMIQSGAASGHNMATKAGEALLKWLVHTYPELKEVSVSGNYCTDKKVSAVNGILGRGKNVTAEICLPAEICQKHLRASPQAIVDLNYKKNLVGSTLAGSLRSANAHYANILLALYLATGQDAANIIEGSQGITYASVTADDELRFSVNIPNIIVGVVGNGKHHDFVQKNLTAMGCDPQNGQLSAQRLAIITAATVLCSELSLLAALTNSGELMHTHVVFERHHSQVSGE